MHGFAKGMGIFFMVPITICRSLIVEGVEQAMLGSIVFQKING
jgi:hypothetical protein